MKPNNYLVGVILVLLCVTATAEDCWHEELAEFCQVRAAALRLLTEPVYTGSDEKILKRSGDLAAVAIMKTVPTKEVEKPENARQILLVLQMAFAAPQLITNPANKLPTASTLLLDRLEQTSYGQSPNAVGNVRGEIEHNTSTGKPFEMVSLPGQPVIDYDHTSWVGNIVNWTHDIHPGMTRRDLLRLFTMESGISTPTHRSYVLKECRYIHVDVEFSLVGPRQNLMEMPEDEIAQISKPYLD
jgi:hypothetical protein